MSTETARRDRSLADRTRSLYAGARRVLPSPIRVGLDDALAVARNRPVLIRHVDLAVGIARHRLHPERLFVGWLLSGDENNGGARVRGLLPHHYLRTHGVTSVILSKPWRPVAFQISREDIDRIVRARFDVVVFQRVRGRPAQRLARALSEAGTRTVYTDGDLLPSTMPDVVDWVVAASEGIGRIADGHPHKTSVIEGVVDCPPGLVKDHSRPPGGGEIRVVWVGYPENLHLLAPIHEALMDPRLRGFRLVTISRGPGVTHQWDRRSVWGRILVCDIAVLPSGRSDWYQAKPNTRLVMFKALGLPIVASPIPSYVHTLSHGQSCFFAQTTEEWVTCLARLADPETRRAIGLTDRDRILQMYGLDAIGGRWLTLFQQLVNRSAKHTGRTASRGA